jgi:dTMP kinase
VKRGSFVVFEGADGSGKSTQLRLLAAWLRARGHEVVETAEPWEGGAWGARVRAMLRSGETLPAEEELRWFFEQRREHVRELVEPSLARGCVVLCDRYYLSTVAYQGARGLDPAAILAASEAEFPLPDVAIVLELAAGEGLRRARARGGPHEPAFEEEARQARVAAILAGLERPYLERIDAAGSPDAVHARILGTLRARGLPRPAP